MLSRVVRDSGGYSSAATAHGESVTSVVGLLFRRVTPVRGKRRGVTLQKSNPWSVTSVGGLLFSKDGAHGQSVPY